MHDRDVNETRVSGVSGHFVILLELLWCHTNNVCVCLCMEFRLEKSCYK